MIADDLLDRPKTRLYLVQIAVKVKGDKAIVRKVTYHGNGKVAGRYGLTRNGEWVWVKECEKYPDECILPVWNYSDDEAEEVIIGTIYESVEELRAMGVEVGDGGTRDGMGCKRCKRVRGLIDGLCDDCTLELYGCLFPWLDQGDEAEVEVGDD